MSKKQENVSVLSDEHLFVKKYMQDRTFLHLRPPGGREKNIADSIRYRQKGNDLYKKKDHNEKMHEKIWRTYTQSIALAPNNSEELACGYGNRSALMFHLEKFKECIKDCDRALSITKSDVLKVKLLTRKAECLLLLNKPAVEDVSKEALQVLEKIQKNDKAMELYYKKLQNLLSAASSTSTMMGREAKKNDKKLRKKYINELSNFPRSQELPCASTSVALKYNKEFGRHLVATKDMRPGEIFAIEKNCFTYITGEGTYLYCSNCAKAAWSSIPCEHCIFDVYCSESCRSEAWDKYHKWDCSVYPHLWDVNENVEACLPVMRFTLFALNEVGGTENMKKLIADLDKYNDPRTKGFSDGVFHEDSVKSIYSLSKHKEIDPSLIFQLSEIYCINTYLTAKHTTFFGQKMNISVSEIFKNKDVLFFAALLLHSHFVMHGNIHHQAFTRNEEESLYATAARSFSSLINHNCDPNMELFMTKQNTTVAFTIKPVKKGMQLAISYSGITFLRHPKKYRQEFLLRVHEFTCKCLACTENWSNICLPELKTISKLTPDLRVTLYQIMNNMSKFKKIRTTDEIVYSHKIMRDLVYYLESVAEKFTTNCDMYQNCLQCLDKMFWDVFGSFHFSISEKCFTN